MTTNFIETKAAFTVSDAGEIEGTARIFSQADRTGDVILPAAFASAKTPLPILASHDPSATIGVWNSMHVIGDKLIVKGTLLLDSVEKARETYALIKSGAMQGLSVGFRTLKSSRRIGGGRLISNLDLVEISAVSVPAHPGARITSAKSAKTASDVLKIAEAINRAASAHKLRK